MHCAGQLQVVIRAANETVADPEGAVDADGPAMGGGIAEIADAEAHGTREVRQVAEVDASKDRVTARCLAEAEEVAAEIVSAADPRQGTYDLQHIHPAGSEPQRRALRVSRNEMLGVTPSSASP